MTFNNWSILIGGHLVELEPDFQASSSENNVIKGSYGDRWGPSIPPNDDVELSDGISDTEAQEVLNTGKEVDAILVKALNKNVKALRKYLADRGNIDSYCIYASYVQYMLVLFILIGLFSLTLSFRSSPGGSSSCWEDERCTSSMARILQNA